MLERLTWKLRATLLGNHASRSSTVQHTPPGTIADHTDHTDQATHSSRKGQTPPEVLEDSEGRNPLINWDLDLYPQPPLNTHSPTLNSEEPV